jgi:hypothetical protein
MLFGFEHPGVAADLYTQAAADTAADSTVAARALFGAYLTYDQYLDKPDSAAIFAQELKENYPESPQAFEIQSGHRSNLLGYLLARQESQQRERYANLSEEEKTALHEVSDFSGSLTGVIHGLPGIRRRMVYLSRRPNILFEPSDKAVMAAQLRQTQVLEEAARGIATRDSLRAASEAEGLVVPDSGDVSGGVDPPVTEEKQAAGAEETKDEDKEEDKKEDEKKEKKQDDNWDFLR